MKKRKTMNKYDISGISYSAIRDYKKCPRLYYYRRICKLKLPKTPLPLVFGKSLHLALELYVKDGRDPVEVFKADFTHDKLDYLDLDKFKEELDAGIHLLEFWKENNKVMLALEGFSINETEIPFELMVDKDPYTGLQLDLPPFKGVVDFTTDSDTDALGDYKTSNKPYTKEMVDESDQPTFYYLWHLISRGRLPKKFFYIVFRKKIKKVPVSILSTTRNLKQISELLQDIVSVVRKIRAGKFDERHKEGEYCDCHLYEEMLFNKKYEKPTGASFRSRKVVHNHSGRKAR